MDQVSSTEKAPPHAPGPSVDVAIIGAGPVGLMLANYLGQVGLSVLLLEKLNDIIDYPRAIGIDDEALRAFQAVGLAQTLAPHTTPHHWMRFLTSSGRCFASIEPRIEEYGWPRRNAFIQPLADQVLYQGLSRFPRVSVLFSHTVESFSQDDEGVTIHAHDDAGETVVIRASYLVGCDGGNSFVRRTLDIPFEGRTKPNQWIVIDIKNDPIGTPHVYLCGDPVRPYVSAALPHGVRRFEFMVMPGETEEELSQPEKIAALMRKVVADPDKVDYIRKRVYTHNARLAREFRVGRVLLAGDAAHIMPVWQGQGYNSGMRDAFNLGWKLAMVLKGQADDHLLDTYSDERRAHARSMIHLSEVAGDIFAPQGKFAAKFRDVMSYMLGGLPSVKRYFIEMRFKPMPRYEKGVVVGPTPRDTEPFLARVLLRSGSSATGRILGLMSEKRESLIGRLVYGWRLPPATAVGRMFMQPKVTTSDGRLVPLDDLIGPRFAVIAWGTDPTYGLSDEAREVWERLDARFIMLKPSVQLAHPQPLPDNVMVLGDPDGQIREWFGNMPHAVVLLRPDRFVAATCGPQQLSATTLAIAQKVCLSNKQRIVAEGVGNDAQKIATVLTE